MIIKLKYSLLVLLLFCCYFSIAQDIHFSQFWLSPLNLNPANTGQFDGDYRFVLNNKSQWISFADAYSTFAGSADAGFEDILFEKSKLGIGLQINNDIAGDGRLTTNQFIISTAFSYYWNNTKTLKTSLGFAPSYTINSIQFSNFRFGSQYFIDRYYPDIDPQETWKFEKINYFSFNTGIYNSYLIDTGLNINFGLSVFQFNEPHKGFFEYSDFYLPVRWSYNLQAEYNIVNDLWLESYFLYMKQHKYKEIIAGGLFRFNNNIDNFRSFYLGALIRLSDAGIFVVGTDYQNIKFTISYDVNISGLTKISRGRGGFEFSMIYIIYKPRAFETPYFRKCPDFI